jgi:hypothetical protein
MKVAQSSIKSQDPIPEENQDPNDNEQTDPDPTKPLYASWGKGGLNVRKGSVVELTLNNDSTSRYYLYVPTNYNEAEPMGLVILFHGVEGTNTPNAFISLSALTSKERYILISPVGDLSHGGSGAWCQPYTREIQLLVERKYNVDLRRKYVAAVSGGGLPAILYGLHGNNSEYSYCGKSIQSGFQSEFAGFGFTASAYSPSQFSNLKGVSAATLGFTPMLWADYGELSNDAGNANDLSTWGKGLGFKVELHQRPGEGHSPQAPYNFMDGMFDMFATVHKPIGVLP